MDSTAPSFKQGCQRHAGVPGQEGGRDWALQARQGFLGAGSTNGSAHLKYD